MGRGNSPMTAEVCSELPPGKTLPVKEKWDLLSDQHPYLESTLEPKSEFMLLFSTQ